MGTCSQICRQAGRLSGSRSISVSASISLWYDDSRRIFSAYTHTHTGVVSIGAWCRLGDCELVWMLMSVCVCVVGM